MYPKVFRYPEERMKTFGIPVKMSKTISAISYTDKIPEDDLEN